MTTSAIAALITPLIGRSVIATNKDGTEARYTIARLADKTGTLKDGSKGEYVVLTKDGETGVVMNLHPNVAKKLATRGEGDMLKLIEAGAVTETKAAEVSTAVVAPVESVEAASTETNTAESEAPKDEEPAAKEPKVTKKSQTLSVFKLMTAEGKSRKEIVARLKSELGLSDACCNTYFQNCKSGAWV